MWSDLIQKAKEGGLDTIETYIFWNAHERRRREVGDSPAFIFDRPDERRPLPAIYLISIVPFFDFVMTV